MHAQEKLAYLIQRYTYESLRRSLAKDAICCAAAIVKREFFDFPYIIIGGVPSNYK